MDRDGVLGGIAKREKLNEDRNHAVTELDKINALHAGADEESRVYQAKIKADRRRQLSSLSRKLTFDNEASGAQSPAGSPAMSANNNDTPLSPSRKKLSRSDSTQSVAQVQQETSTEVHALKTKLVQERDRQKAEMKRRLEARRRVNQRKVRLRATVGTPSTAGSSSDGGYATGDDHRRYQWTTGSTVRIVEK